MCTQRRLNQPGHLPWVFAVHSMGNWGPKVSSSRQRRLWSDWVDVQANLSLHWTHSNFVGTTWQLHRTHSNFVGTTWQNQQNECAPSEDQISLGICPVWSESSQCTQWIAEDPRFPHADSEDSDQTGWMPRLIWVFAGHTAILLAQHDKTNKMSVRPAKTRISLGVCPVWSESLQCAQWVAKDPRFPHADGEDSDQTGWMPRLIYSDQTGWMPRLIWVFAGCTAILLVLCRGSNLSLQTNFETLVQYLYWHMTWFWYTCTNRIMSKNDKKMSKCQDRELQESHLISHSVLDDISLPWSDSWKFSLRDAREDLRYMFISTNFSIVWHFIEYKAAVM